MLFFWGYKTYYSSIFSQLQMYNFRGPEKKNKWGIKSMQNEFNGP